ncbi:phosphotyrosine protein phosphatase [bacterium]|nr:phosphotyrosine protein phosphatase [bacterium]
MNVLFLCSRNQWRSPTAEQVWRDDPRLSVRSAGLSPQARRRVTVGDLDWADVIFVMEDKHKTRLMAEFSGVVCHTPVHVLHIPDEYRCMDPELVSELRRSVAGILNL